MGVGGQLQDLSVLNLSTPAAVLFTSTVSSSAFQTFCLLLKIVNPSGQRPTQHPVPTDHTASSAH